LPHAGAGGPDRKARGGRRRVHDHGRRRARGTDAHGKRLVMLERFSDRSGDPDHNAAVDWVARAREVAPLLARAADRIERERALPEVVVSPVQERELFRLLLPASCGGAELQPGVYLQVIEEIAKADASTAWCLGQGCGGTIAAAYLKPDVL